ncbi:MAG: transporter substrate-binding domain-containing protein [Bacteroidetes bacterium]|nr:transporter substrate-binding domain-containing protein [Bacteroidota bacterium]
MHNLSLLIIILFLFNCHFQAQTEKTKYVYGGDKNFSPYEYLNEEGEPEGFNIDVIKAIAAEMQIEVEFKLGHWSQIREELERTNKIDISDMFYSSIRDSLVDFSIPFTIAYDEIFIRKNTKDINSLEDLYKKKAIVQNMSFVYDKLKKNYPSIDLITVESEPEALQLLSSGIGDCAILSQTVTRNIFQVKNYPNIIRAGSPIFPKEYAFVVKDGNSELLRIINNGLVRLKDKKILDEIEDNWFGQKEEEYKNIKTFVTYLIYLLIFLLLITSVIIAWNRSLKKQVLLKTASLLDAHKNFSDTLENMNEGFYLVNKNWTIININEHAAILLNKNSNELLNKNLWEEFPHLKAHLYLVYIKSFEMQKISHMEFFFEPSERWYENRIIPSENGLAVFFRDITEKKKADEIIKESESNLKSLIENSTEAIWAIDSEYKFIIYNNILEKRFYEFFENPISKGMSAINFKRGEQNEFWKNKYDIALSGKKLSFEINIRNHNDLKYYEVYLNPIIIDKVVKGVSVFRIDITESKKREIQLTEAKEKAEKSDKLKTEFLAQISHEIRTPINNILNYTGLLSDRYSGKQDDDTQLIFESVASSSKRIMRTIDMILNMSEIQLGAYNSIIKKIDLIDDVIKPIMNEYSYNAIDKNIDLTFSSAYDKMFVNGDQYSLLQIFSNLIDNAIKYTKEGNVSVDASLNYDNEIVITITDTGIGISDEFLPNIFEPFRQEEQGYTRSYEGNGVGLALVKKYCEINNAIIEVKSSKLEGTTFTLYFELVK